jgi:hypothetical protein
VDALDAEREHLLRNRLLDLAPQPDEVRVVLQTRGELGGVMPSRRASWARCALSPSRSFGIAQIDGAGTLDARIRPLRSTMRPRLAGRSSVRP